MATSAVFFRAGAGAVNCFRRQTGRIAMFALYNIPFSPKLTQ